MLRSTLSVTLAAAALLYSTGCGDDAEFLDSLAATPTAILIGPDTVTIEAWANRDFMPVDPNDSLVAVATVHPDSASVSIEQLWVVRGDDIWRAAPSELGSTNSWVAKYGPKWPIGDDVYIVAEIRPEVGGPTARVRSLPVTITESS